MRLTSTRLLALLAIAALTDALPFAPKPRGNRPLARRKVTYSVVPVDGGSTTAAAATTVIESTTVPPITQTQLSTLLSTIVVTAFESPTTVVITITETPLPAPSTSESTSIPESTPAPSYSESPSTTTVTSAVTDCTTSTTTTTSPYAELTTMTNILTPSAVISVTTLPPEIITVTALPSSTPWDDGMWHTTYFHPVYDTTTSTTSSSSYAYTPTTSHYSYPSMVLSSPTAAPSLDTNIGMPVNGTLAALGPRDNVVRTPTIAIAEPTYIIAMYYPTLEEV